MQLNSLYWINKRIALQRLESTIRQFDLRNAVVCRYDLRSVMPIEKLSKM